MSYRRREPEDGYLEQIYEILFKEVDLYFVGIQRDQRASRAALFDDIEGGGIAVSHDFDERDNDRAVDDLHDRVNFLKRITGDIHEEVENHNKMLNRIGNEMDASRGIMYGTIDRFKMVFEKKSNRKICKLVAGIVVSFLIMFYLIRFLVYYTYG